MKRLLYQLRYTAMVGETGIEPANLSVPNGALYLTELLPDLSLAGNSWWTGMDLNHRRPALQAGALPLSYRSVRSGTCTPQNARPVSGRSQRRCAGGKAVTVPASVRWRTDLFGRNGPIRTDDLSVPNRKLYQTELHSD